MTDFTRNVHCVMGLPIDSMTLDEAVRHLQHARMTRSKCFFSTPNLNFLIASHKHTNFRESVCMSDLSLADGMPLVWVSKLLNIPIHERVSGSDLFERLRRQTESLWRVFFFGGQKGVGQEACLSIGSQTPGMVPTGYIYPGFGTTEEMSREDLLSCINHSVSDMVVVSLGAAKGQDWICRNHGQIEAPIIGHLGAVINFVAGTVRRAPQWMQRSGLEWVWRAKEESSLIRRYLHDGLAFLGLLATRVAPLMLHQAKHKPQSRDLENAHIAWGNWDGRVRMELQGAWNNTNLESIRRAFAAVEQEHSHVLLDMAKVHSIDSGFVGLLLLLEQALSDRCLTLRLTNTPKPVRKYLRLSNVHHLEVE